MKNRPTYRTRWKRKRSGKIVPRKVEVKRETLYCYFCARYRPIVCFPHESGWGSEAQHRTICKKCIKRKHLKGIPPFDASLPFSVCRPK